MSFPRIRIARSGLPLPFPFISLRVCFFASSCPLSDCWRYFVNMSSPPSSACGLSLCLRRLDSQVRQKSSISICKTVLFPLCRLHPSPSLPPLVFTPFFRLRDETYLSTCAAPSPFAYFSKHSPPFIPCSSREPSLFPAKTVLRRPPGSRNAFGRTPSFFPKFFPRKSQVLLLGNTSWFPPFLAAAPVPLFPPLEQKILPAPAKTFILL